jgi:hypothetical protein
MDISIFFLVFEKKYISLLLFVSNLYTKRCLDIYMAMIDLNILYFKNRGSSYGCKVKICFAHVAFREMPWESSKTVLASDDR